MFRERGCVDSEAEIIRAATRGDRDEVVQALAGGESPNIADEADNTPIACAGPRGHVDVVQELVDAGADPDTIARDGDSVVADAVRFCQPNVLGVLLDEGADPDGPMGNNSPLADAVRGGRAHAAEMLLAAGADVDAFDESFSMFGGAESTSACAAPTAAGRGSALLVVLEAGASPAVVLGHAADGGDMAAVSAALGAGADPDAPEASSPLLSAIDRGESEMVAALLAGGAGPEAGTQVAVSDLEGLRCLMVVTDPEVARGLKACAPVQGLQIFSEGGSAAEFLDDVEAISDPDGKYPSSPLLHAAWSEDRDIVGKLLDAGADPNGVSSFGFTPLHAAAAWGNGLLVGDLIEAGARPASGPAASPGEVALRAGHADLAALLVELE